MDPSIPPPPRLVRCLASRGDLGGLSDELARRLPSVPGAILVLDLAGVAGRFEAGSVEQLARAALAARRHGWTLRITGAPPALVELIELMGLRGALLEPPG